MFSCASLSTSAARLTCSAAGKGTEPSKLRPTFWGGCHCWPPRAGSTDAGPAAAGAAAAASSNAATNDSMVGRAIQAIGREGELWWGGACGRQEWKGAPVQRRHLPIGSTGQEVRATLLNSGKGSPHSPDKVDPHTEECPASQPKVARISRSAVCAQILGHRRSLEISINQRSAREPAAQWPPPLPIGHRRRAAAWITHVLTHVRSALL